MKFEKSLKKLGRNSKKNGQIFYNHRQTYTTGVRAHETKIDEAYSRSAVSIDTVLPSSIRSQSELNGSGMIAAHTG